jgi:hypothetical protein
MLSCGAVVSVSLLSKAKVFSHLRTGTQRPKTLFPTGSPAMIHEENVKKQYDESFAFDKSKGRLCA